MNDKILIQPSFTKVNRALLNKTLRRVLKNIKIAYLFFFLLFTTGPILSEEKRYGSLFFNENVPNVLFLTGDIKKGDSFNFRKALRNHDIDTVVLASPGGLVMEGLNMAGIVYDKALRVFVPRGAECASSCAFMFFAGRERKVEGRLGVHQFASDFSETQGDIQTAEAVAQYAVSEIIGFLNEFGTPRFVLEKIFQQKKMYWFNKSEIDSLSTERFALSKHIETSINDLWNKRDLGKNHSETSTRADLISFIQTRLNEIGCDSGLVDGKYGKRTEGAIRRFSKIAKLEYSDLANISEDFLKKLKAAPKGFCPKVRTSFPNIKFYKSYATKCYPDAVVAFKKWDPKRRKFFYRTTMWGFVDNGSATFRSDGTWDGDNGDDGGRFFYNSTGYVYKITYQYPRFLKNCVLYKKD